MEYACTSCDLFVVPLRSPITRGARGARCGSSSLRRVWKGVERMESRSHYRAARPTEQLTLGVVLLHAPLTASGTGGETLLARLDTRSPLGLLLVGPEPALLRSLHLGHRTTVLTRAASTQEVARRREHVSRRNHQRYGHRGSCAARSWEPGCPGFHAQSGS